MTIRNVWLLACERVLLDEPTQNLSLISCIDSASVPSVPAQAPAFALAALLRDEHPSDKDREVAYRFVRVEAGREEEIVAELASTWAASVPTSRVFVNFRYLRIHREGRIGFRLDWRVTGADWIQGATTEIDVSISPSHEAGPP